MEVHIITDGDLVLMAGAIDDATFLALKFGRALIVNPIPAASNVLQIAICVFASGRSAASIRKALAISGSLQWAAILVQCSASRL